MNSELENMLADESPTIAAGKFEPQNNIVQYDRANYTATTEQSNGFAAAAAAVAQYVDHLTFPSHV